MTTYLFIDHNNELCAPSNFKAAQAAQQMGGDIIAIVAGHDCKDVAQGAATIAGVTKVVLADQPELAHQPAEMVTPILMNLLTSGDAIIAASSTVTRNIMPRLAAKLDVMQISDVIEVLAAKSFVRPIYAGNALSHVSTNDDVVVATIRTTAFQNVGEQAPAAIEQLSAQAVANAHNEFVGEELSKSDRPELTSAKIVISGGRGMQNGENFAMLEKVADKLGAAIGASRAAVDAGFVPNDYQVGQTGKAVAPELYIAVGISGAIQHLAGMKDSKTIVAINKDEEAPIYQVADYGLVADLFQAVPEFEEKI